MINAKYNKKRYKIEYLNKFFALLLSLTFNDTDKKTKIPPKTIARVR